MGRGELNPRRVSASLGGSGLNTGSSTARNTGRRVDKQAGCAYTINIKGGGNGRRLIGGQLKNQRPRPELRPGRPAFRTQRSIPGNRQPECAECSKGAPRSLSTPPAGERVAAWKRRDRIALFSVSGAFKPMPFKVSYPIAMKGEDCGGIQECDGY